MGVLKEVNGSSLMKGSEGLMIGGGEKNTSVNKFLSLQVPDAKEWSNTKSCVLIEIDSETM